ncbi:hypothetical protein BGZ99_005590 [Dissophora globulifera]|uniref:Uncharacterized protein n=1 Tax=Dissophora globulifera TaxID=979702 RepID=A0A9P6REE6_9FUNG|nr:hypothetical protein BGZ99_005590 [Dissophora globulifera]
MPGFLQETNSSFQSLPMQQQRQQLQQQRHQMQRGEDQELEADEYEYRPPNPRFRHSRHNSGSSGSASSKEKSMGLSSLGSRPHVPPLPPTAFLIVNNNNSTHHFGGSLQQPAKLLATTTTTTAAAVGNHSSGNSKLFKNFSARFNNPTTTQAIPVIETVAQQYARTIKALWQMVEDEELSYQIDAAVTAAREQAAALQQQQGRPSLQSKASEEVLHRICHEPCCVGTATSTGGAGSVRGGHRQPAHSTVRTNSSGTLIQHSKTLSSPISKQPQSQSQKQQVRDLAPQVQRQPSEEEYPSWTWGRLTSGAQPPLPSSLQGQQQTTESDNDEDEGEGSEEDREQRKRELEELERELVTLGLQRHQGPVHASATLVRHEKSSAQEPSSSSATTASRAYTSPLTVQVGAQVAQPSQGSQPQSPLKQQPIPQRRQRQRQNSLAYEERRSEQDALHRSYYTATITNNNNNNIKSSSSSSIPSTPTTVSSLSKPPAMLDFHDGILHEEESDASSNTGLSSSFSKMDEDGVVLSVAHRVTVRPRTQDLSVFQKASGPGQNRQQRPSWEVERARGRGVAASWTATTMTAAAARAQAQKQQQSSRARIGSLPTVATPSVSTMISAR